MPDHDLSRQTFYSFYQVNRLFHKFYTQALHPFNLTYTQYTCLVVLWEHAPISLVELGKILDLSSNTLTPLLKRLEEKGYVTRTVPEHDKRQLIINLTQTGSELEHPLSTAILDNFAQLGNIDKPFTQNVIASNTHIIQSLKNYLKQN